MATKLAMERKRQEELERQAAAWQLIAEELVKLRKAVEQLVKVSEKAVK
jgi:hypothetical protein